MKHFEHAELAKIEGAGHWLQHDKPDEVLDLLKKILRLGRIEIGGLEVSPLAIRGCVRAVPHAKSADKGIGVVAGPAFFRQFCQVHEISATDDYILGFGGRDQSFDHILNKLPPTLFTNAFEAPVANSQPAAQPTVPQRLWLSAMA